MQGYIHIFPRREFRISSIILLILRFPSVVSGFIMWTNTVRIKTFFPKIQLIALEYKFYKYTKIPLFLAIVVIYFLPKQSNFIKCKNKNHG